MMTNSSSKRVHRGSRKALHATLVIVHWIPHTVYLSYVFEGFSYEDFQDQFYVLIEYYGKRMNKHLPLDHYVCLYGVVCNF